MRNFYGVFVVFFIVTMALIFTGCVSDSVVRADSEMMPGITTAQSNGTVFNDNNDHRTATAQAFNSATGGNAEANSKGMKVAAAAVNTGKNGTAKATAKDPFESAIYGLQNKDGAIISSSGSDSFSVSTPESITLGTVANKGGMNSSEDLTLDALSDKGAVSSAKATNVTANGRVAVVSDRIFDLSKLGGMRYRVVESRDWERNINRNVHPHAAPILSAVEGGPSMVAHKDIEFMKLAPGTILFECTPAVNNFIYGLFAVKSLGPHAYNLMQNYALRSFVKGRTEDGDWVVGGYFYLSDLLVETDSPIVVAEAPWKTKKERIRRQLSEYEKIMGRAADPTEEVAPIPKKANSRGEEVKNIVDQRKK